MKKVEIKIKARKCGGCETCRRNIFTQEVINNIQIVGGKDCEGINKIAGGAKIFRVEEGERTRLGNKAVCLNKN